MELYLLLRQIVGMWAAFTFMFPLLILAYALAYFLGQQIEKMVLKFLGEHRD